MASQKLKKSKKKLRKSLKKVQFFQKKTKVYFRANNNQSKSRCLFKLIQTIVHCHLSMFLVLKTLKQLYLRKKQPHECNCNQTTKLQPSSFELCFTYYVVSNKSRVSRLESTRVRLIRFQFKMRSLTLIGSKNKKSTHPIYIST